jgi:hypothetical protein
MLNSVFKSFIRFFAVFLLCFGLLHLLSEVSFAQYGYSQMDESQSFKDILVRLLRGPMGTLFMIFCGFSGFAFLFIQRQGKGGQQTPIAGVVLLILAVLLFILRVSLNSGVMGAKYLDYGP